MLLRSYIKPVLTFQAIEADRITATASYTVACDTSIANSTIGGKMLYTMEISRYTDMRNVSIKCFSNDGQHKEDEQFAKVEKSSKGYFTTWKYHALGQKSMRIYLPDEFEKVYEWGF